ncbi:MAG: hypothetical protein ACE5EA_08445 [Nitrospirota bacterium]
MCGLVKTCILACLGVHDKVSEVVDELIKRGETNNNDCAKAIRESIENIEKNTKECDKRIREYINSKIDKINIASKVDIETLKRQVEEILERLGSLETGQAK